MILPAEICEQLRKGPTEFDWPRPTEPHRGKVYKLQSGGWEWTFVVVRHEALEVGWRVCARLHSDPIRLLGKTGGFTDAFHESLQVRDSDRDSEPEAIDPEAEQSYADRSRLRQSNQLSPIVAELIEIHNRLERIHRNPAAKSVRSQLYQARGRVAEAQGRLSHQMRAA